MKHYNPRHDINLAAAQRPVNSVYPIHAEGAQQEQMRRLHNARARERAALHHRRASAS